jgi:hypothetical protein
MEAAMRAVGISAPNNRTTSPHHPEAYVGPPWIAQAYSQTVGPRMKAPPVAENDE